MRMIGKARARLHAEMVEHQERREVLQLRRADTPAHPCARALGLLNGQEGLADKSWDGHVGRMEEFAWCWELDDARADKVSDPGAVEVGVQGRCCLEDVLFEQEYGYESDDGREQERNERLHLGWTVRLRCYIENGGQKVQGGLPGHEGGTE